MNRTLHYFLFSFLFISPLFSQNDSLIIGEGLSNTLNTERPRPFYRSSASSSTLISKSIHLYKASDLVGLPQNSLIETIAFDKADINTLSNGRTSTLKIYLKNSSNSDLSNGITWDNMIENATLFYSNENEILSNEIGFYNIVNNQEEFYYFGGSIEVYVNWQINGVALNATTGAMNSTYDTPQNSTIQTMGSTFVTDNPDFTDWISNNRVFHFKVKYLPPQTCDVVSGPTILSSVSSACLNSTLDINAMGGSIATNLTYQWEKAPFQTSNFNPILGETSRELLNYTQIESSTYRLKVTCPTTSVFNYSNSIDIPQASFINCYCDSKAQTNIDATLGDIVINGVLLHLDCNFTAPGSRSIKNQYADFTESEPIYIDRINPVSFKINYKSCGSDWDRGIGVYVDFNQNGSFESNEVVYRTLLVSNIIFSESGSFEVPLDAKSGITMMRVVLMETNNANNIDPCVEYSFGETADILVEIGSCPEITLAENNLSIKIKQISGALQTYINNDCVGICSIQSVLPNYLRDSVTTSVFLDSTIQESSNGLKYLQRHFLIAPSNGDITATYKATFFVPQDEMDTYNAAIIGTPQENMPMPSNGINNGNVRVTFYKNYIDNPENASPNSFEILTPQVHWDIVNQWWRVNADAVGVGSFYLHTTLDESPLPLANLDLKGMAKNGYNHILFEISTPNKFDKIELEKSNDAITFSNLKIKSNKAESFEHIDSENIECENYYRVKHTSAQTFKETFSNIVKVLNVNNKINVQVFPNPAFQTICIKNLNTKENMLLELLDIQGKVYTQTTITQENTELNIENILPGAYILRFTTNQSSEIKKINIH